MGETIELYPGHAEELRRHAARIEKLESAAGNPLPGPLLSAYAAVPFEVAGFRIRPVVHYDFVLLARLESPLMTHLRGSKSAATPFTDEQGYDMVWHFCRPVRQVAAEIAAYESQALRESPACPPADVARRVRELFRARSVDEVGLTLGPVEVGLLVKAVEREFLRAFSTVVNYEAQAAEDGQTFTAPPARATTDSAGGLITSQG